MAQIQGVLGYLMAPPGPYGPYRQNTQNTGFSPFLTLFHPLSTPGQAWPKYPPQQGINGPLQPYLTPFGTPGQKGQKVVILDPLFDPFLALLALLARRAQYPASW